MTGSNKEEKKSDCTHRLVQVREHLEAHAITRKGTCLLRQSKNLPSLQREAARCRARRSGLQETCPPWAAQRGAWGAQPVACGGAAWCRGEMEHRLAQQEQFPRPLRRAGALSQSQLLLEPLLSVGFGSAPVSRFLLGHMQRKRPVAYP